MKKIPTILSLAMLMSAYCCAPGQSSNDAAGAADSVEASPYLALMWHGGCDCAITYSLDDLTPNQLPVAVPLLDKYGVKATFNVVITWVKENEWPQLKKLAENGHEIASHTVTHQNMQQLSPEDFEKESRDSKAFIEKAIGRECVTMVYPFCASAHKEIIAKYYISARGCNGKIMPGTPPDMYDISSKGAGTESSDLRNGDDFNRWVDEGVQANGWCTFLIHAIDGDGAYSPIESSELEKHLAYVTQNPKKFWVATFVQITKYIIERDALTFDETVDGSVYTLKIGCTAKSPLTTFDEPVTISRFMPDGFKTAVVTSGGGVVQSSIEGGSLMFDVVPGTTYQISFK